MGKTKDTHTRAHVPLFSTECIRGCVTDPNIKPKSFSLAGE